MRRTALIVIAALLLGALGAGYYFWEREHSPTAKAVKVLRSSLFDPESSQFQDIKHFSTTGATCGLVNARNRMGGYVGFTTFVVTKQGDVLLDPKTDTESGTLEQRLAAVQKQIAFLDRLLAECPEPASSSASSPT